MKPKAVAWVVLGVVFVAVVVAVVVRSADESDARRAQRLFRELACPVCTGESIAASNAPEAKVMRRRVVEGIADGLSDRDIKERFVAAYGERILLAPDRGGLGLLAWGLPVLLVAFGGGVLAVTLRRWARAPRLAVTEADEALVARLRNDSQ